MHQHFCMPRSVIAPHALPIAMVVTHHQTITCMHICMHVVKFHASEPETNARRHVFITSMELKKDQRSFTAELLDNTQFDKQRIKHQGVLENENVRGDHHEQSALLVKHFQSDIMKTVCYQRQAVLQLSWKPANKNDIELFDLAPQMEILHTLSVVVTQI